MSFLYLNKKIHDFQRSYKHLGFKNLSKKLIYQRHEELILGKDLTEEVRFSLEEKLDVQSIGKEEAHLLEAFFEQNNIGGRTPHIMIDNSFNNRQNCFIAMLKNNIIGYLWWGNNKVIFDSKDPDDRFIQESIELEDDEVYCFELFVAPEYRSQGQTLEFISKVLSSLYELGYKRAYGFVISDNRPARWIWSLVGFKEIQRVAVRRYLLFLVFKNKNWYLDINGHKTLFQIDWEPV